jgi:hypothetical protein
VFPPTPGAAAASSWVLRAPVVINGEYDAERRVLRDAVSNSAARGAVIASDHDHIRARCSRSASC